MLILLLTTFILFNTIDGLYTTTNTLNALNTMNTYNRDNNNYIHYECIKSSSTTKYIFFASNDTDKNYYAIKTHWVVLHHKKVKTSLLNNGVHVFDDNPSDKCNWLINRDYDWDHDTVLTKNNATAEMNQVAYFATKQSCAIEWFLIFSWTIPIGIALIVVAMMALIYYIKYESNIFDTYRSMV